MYCMHYMLASPTSNKITITTRDVSRPRGKVYCCSFVIDLYCRHFVPYLVLALIINHCFNKLRLPTQQASPPTQCWITRNIWWLCCRGNNLSCSGKSKQRVLFDRLQLPYSTPCQITFPPGATHKYRRFQRKEREANKWLIQSIQSKVA